MARTHASSAIRGSSSASGFQQPTSGSVDGSNQVFIWATTPNVIVADQGRVMQQISGDGTVNWSGTTTTTLTVAPNFDIYSISGTGGGGYQQIASGSIDGSNKIFVFTTAPIVLVVDQGRSMQKVSSDGTVNWTGTTTVTLTVAPNFDIYATA